MPNQSQKPVDIGGQAVLEGVMMKGPEAIAITVRRPDKTMVVDYKKSEPLSKKHKWMGLPIIRASVDHGTGFGHAGDGHANELSLINAMDYGIRMANAKRETAGAQA